MPTRKGGQRPQRRLAERPRLEHPAASTAEQTASEAPARPKAEAKRAPLRNALFPVGASLYPLDSETQTPGEWYERPVGEDVDALANIHAAIVRIFVSWTVLEPQVGQYNVDALDRLAALVSEAYGRKMQTVVCFFADDRYAELSDVGWGKRRDAHSDVYLVQRELALVSRVVTHLRGTSGVFAWQLGNEAFISGFDDSGALTAWTESLCEAIREIDPDRPIVLGADAETLFKGAALDARPAIAVTDFSVSHPTAAYRAYASEGPLTSGPSTYLDGFLLRLAHEGKPVLLDDAGVFSLQASPAEEAAHLRTCLWTGFMNRGAGVLARRMRDMVTERREPYFLDPFETLVGVLDDEGRSKPSFTEMRRFIRTAALVDLRSHQLIAERTAVMMPSERYKPLPSLAGLYDPRACFQSYIVAKQAHLPVTVVREADGFDSLKVLIIPGAFDLEPETWERLYTFVQSGGSIIFSYGGGDAHPAIRDLFGVEFLGDEGPSDALSCRVAHDDLLGRLSSFDVDFDVPNFALLTGAGATVVATDAKCNPLLTVNQVGQGKAILLAAPLERAIAQNDPWATPPAIRDFIAEIYGAVARSAGCGAPVACDQPGIETALFQGDGDDVLVLLNHTPERLQTGITTERLLASIADVRGQSTVAVGAPRFEARVEPNSATVLRLMYA